MIHHMGEAERAVIAHMMNSGGVIHRRAAIAMGMAPRTVDRRVAERTFIKVAPGVIGLPGVVLIEKSMLEAATRSLGAVVSHHSAARLHGVSGVGSDVSVSVPVRRTHEFEGLVVHQLTDLAPGHIDQLQGLPVTNPSRTVIDMAAVLGPGRLADLLDQLVRRRRTTYEDTAEMLENLSRQGKPGVRLLRSVLKPRLGGAFVIDSTLETRLFELVLRAGLEAPDPQHRPKWLRHMNGRVDFAYPEFCLVIEGDSLRFHGSPDLFQADRERDNLAQLAGWTILRFTWHDITKRPEYVVATIRKAIANSVRL